MEIKKKKKHSEIIRNPSYMQKDTKTKRSIRKNKGLRV